MVVWTGRTGHAKGRSNSIRIEALPPLGTWNAVLMDYHAKQTIMDAIMVQNRAIEKCLEIP
ncbi:hypothetical protein GCM10022293_58580 [Azospirillum formosense]